MNQEIQERVRKIHDNFIIVDAHYDLLMDVARKRGLGYGKVIETDHLPGFLASGLNTVVASIYIEDEFLPEMGLRKALDQISALYAEIDESPDKLMLCTTHKDILQAKTENKLGILLSFEGVEPLSNDLGLLRIFYELGVRIVGLVWSRRNYAADGCHFFKKAEGQKGGLTAFGVELVEAAENLGMFIDVSHLNDEGFWDVMKIAKKPVIASHSNCRVLASSMRNLTDEQVKALATKNGIIGMNACSTFIADSDEEVDVEHFVRHVDHIVNLTGGIEHVGIGFDFCDFLRVLKPEPAVKRPRKGFDVISGHKNCKEFTEGLIRHGYTDEQIGLILGGNFLNLFKKVLK